MMTVDELLNVRMMCGNGYLRRTVFSFSSHSSCVVKRTFRCLVLRLFSNFIWAAEVEEVGEVDEVAGAAEAEEVE